MVRIGIIGCGHQGSFYMQALTDIENFPKIEGAVFAAACDIDASKIDAVIEKYPNISTYDNYLDLLDSGEVDMVMIEVPHYDHPIMAREAIKRDIHVLVDKPAGVFTKNVRELNEYAKTKPNVVYGMMFNQRMNPLYIKAKEIVESGVLGEIRYTDWLITTWWRPQAYYDNGSWRATWSGEGGGVLINQAPHQIDLWQWLCGTPEKIIAKMGFGSHRDITVEDDVVALATYKDNNATGVFRTNTHDIMGTDRFEILGNNGKMIIENSTKITLIKLKESEDILNRTIVGAEVRKIMKGGSVSDKVVVEEFEYEDIWGRQHFDVIQNFVNAINHGEKLIAPGAEGIKALSITNAMHLSKFLDTEVKLPIDEDLYYEELMKMIEQEKENL